MSYRLTQMPKGHHKGGLFDLVFITTKGVNTSHNLPIGVDIPTVVAARTNWPSFNSFVLHLLRL